MENLRQSLRMIRDLSTLPSLILQSGMTAAETAHKYIVSNNKKRNNKKRIIYQTEKNVDGSCL